LAKGNRRQKKKRIGAYPYVSVVFSSTLALLVLGILGILLIYSQKLSSLIKQQVQVQVYLNKNISEPQRMRLLKSLEQYDFVALNKENEPKINYISKDEAASRFIKETGEDFVSFLGDNPLHDTFVVNINARHQTEEEMTNIQTVISSLPGVFEVEYVPNLVQSINRNLSRISIVLIGFALILTTVVIILINNTIKLALFSQRFLIRSMQLVGATRSFIRKPFIFRSLLHGLAAGVLASALLFALSEYATKKVPDLILLKDVNSMLVLSTFLIVLGMLLASLSTWSSVHKYLKLSLDELY